MENSEKQQPRKYTKEEAVEIWRHMLAGKSYLYWRQNQDLVEQLTEAIKLYEKPLDINTQRLLHMTK